MIKGNPFRYAGRKTTPEKNNRMPNRIQHDELIKFPSVSAGGKQPVGRGES